MEDNMQRKERFIKTDDGKFNYIVYTSDKIIDKMPVLLFLHGIGERGDNIKDIEKYALPKYLKKISICAFSEILIYNIVQVLLYYIFDIYLYGLTIILAIVVSFVSLAIGFLSLVLSKLFDMAIEIKEENDKTI